MTAVKGRKIFLTIFNFAQAHSLSSPLQDNRRNLWWNRKMTFDTLSHSTNNMFPPGKFSSFATRILACPVKVGLC